jgi:hypothetical protein
MTTNHDPADWAPIRAHAPLTFDLSPAPSPGGPFGKSAAPVTNLPAVPFDLGDLDVLPVLRLTLHLRPGAEPAQLALDVLGLIDALNHCERELGGSGVTWDKGQSRADAERGVVHLVLTPNDQRQARERLAAVANSAAAAELATNGRSFARWEATVAGNAA